MRGTHLHTAVVWYTDAISLANIFSRLWNRKYSSRVRRLNVKLSSYHGYVFFRFITFSRNGHYWARSCAITFIRFPPYQACPYLDCRVNISLQLYFSRNWNQTKRILSQLALPLRLFIENDGSFDPSSPIILYNWKSNPFFPYPPSPPTFTDSLKQFNTLRILWNRNRKKDISSRSDLRKKERKKKKKMDKNFDRSI